MLTQYYTVKHQGQEELTIQKSRFIGYVRRVETEEEAQNFIQEIKKKHHDANHNCSCYMIGEHNQIQKANDDGEPSGTAGVPMLEILLKRELKNVVAVVTRYFGGIKLGAGGLIRAYGGAVNEGVKALGVVERQVQLLIDVTVDYSSSGGVEHALREANYRVQDTSYAENVTFHCVIPIEEEEKFVQDVTNWTSAAAQIEIGNRAWVEIPVES